MMTATLKRDEEENALRKRLFYDGSGQGDDKRIVLLMRNMTKLCFGCDSNEELTKLYNVTLKDFIAIDTSIDKIEIIGQMCDKTCYNIEFALKEKVAEIEQVKTKLTDLKLELEYVEMLKKVNAYPDCPTTEQAIRQVEQRNQDLCVQVSKFRKNIVALNEACRNLHMILEDLNTHPA